MVRNLSKKSYGFMLVCSLSLLLMLTTSCQESKLKAVIEIANKQCPMNMGESGKITSIVYDGSNVVYTFHMNEAVTNIKVLKSNPESMKESVQIMFQNPSKEVKALLELVVKCNAGLKMDFIGNESGEKATCELTTEELKNIFNADSDESKSDLAKLNAQLKMANLQFPVQAGEGIVVEKIELIDDAVVYQCVVDEDLCEIQQIEENAKDVKEGIVETLSDQTDQAVQVFIKTCVACDKNIAYRYIGKESGEHYDVVVTVPELKKMLKTGK